MISWNASHLPGFSFIPGCTRDRRPGFARAAPVCPGRKRQEPNDEIEERPIAPTDPAPPDSEELLDAITTSLEDHLAEDMVVVELKGKSSIADYMVIASGRANRQVIAMAEHLAQLLKGRGLVGITPEGLQRGDWVLIDAGDVIVHLFRPEVREFYNVEKMWGAELPEPDRGAGAPA